MPYVIKSNVIRGKKHFHLGVWVDASQRELDEIEFVEYTLHPTFKKTNRHSRNRPNNFSITFWTWGVFNIKIAIHLHSGEIVNMDYYLEYELPSDNSEYSKI